jgi:hypothetical protein
MGDNNPPLSARKAEELAAKVKATLVSDTKDYTWKLSSVSLMPIPFGDDRWVWIVRYEVFGRRSKSGQRIDLALVVLMDGTVIRPHVVSGC